jgi:hypothetical protein
MKLVPFPFPKGMGKKGTTNSLGIKYYNILLNANRVPKIH